MKLYIKRNNFAACTTVINYIHRNCLDFEILMRFLEMSFVPFFMWFLSKSSFFWNRLSFWIKYASFDSHTWTKIGNFSWILVKNDRVLVVWTVPRSTGQSGLHMQSRKTKDCIISNQHLRAFNPWSNLVWRFGTRCSNEGY